jgi:hypothetical protein
VGVPAVFTNSLPEPSSAVPIVSTARTSACNEAAKSVFSEMVLKAR